MSPRTLTLVFSFFALLPNAADAAIFSSNATLSPGYSVNEAVSVLGNLTLSPGNYSAVSWTVTGNCVLSAPGDYEIKGRISILGQIVGPAGGAASVRLIDRYTLVGGASTNVTILEGAAPVTPPPTTPTAPPSAEGTSAPLVNLSVRATLAAGQIVNPGFVVGGSVSRRVLIRAVGPALSAFGVASPIAAPSLAVYSGERLIAERSAWDAELASVFAAVGAFALPAGSRDAAAVLTLAPGAYTVQVGGGAGEVLVEVYFVD